MDSQKNDPAVTRNAQASQSLIEKTMSITPHEFEAGISRLDPGAIARRQTTGEVTTYLVEAEPNDTNNRRVSISFAKLPPAVLGGLMRLPRARVLIDLQDLATPERQPFVSRFDRTFQRGGG